MTNRKRLLVALVALLAIVLPLVGITITDGTDSQGQPIYVVQLKGVHGTGPVRLEVPKKAVDAARARLEQDLRSENPEGVPPAQLDAAREQQEKLAETDQLPIVFPGAAPEQRGCTTRLVRNYSSRRGVRPRVFVLHFTVSANRPGWSDVNAIVSLFDTASFQASSNYVIDNEGNCAYIVRESDKAWTQAAANPISISAEVVNTGREPTYAGSAGLQKIAMVVSDALKRWEIPVQPGLVTGCTVQTAGIVDHRALGPCGGGHTDISPYSVPAVIAAVKAYRATEGAQTKPTYKISIVNASGQKRAVVYRDSPGRYLTELNVARSKLRSVTVTRVVR